MWRTRRGSRSRRKKREQDDEQHHALHCDGMVWRVSSYLHGRSLLLPEVCERGVEGLDCVVNDVHPARVSELEGAIQASVEPHAVLRL